MVKILDPNDDEIERLSDVVFTRLNGTEVRKYWPIDVRAESLTMVLFDGNVMGWQDLSQQGYVFTPGAILAACFRLSRSDTDLTWCMVFSNGDCGRCASDGICKRQGFRWIIGWI